MKVPIYQVDAFTDRVFQGNPAAVCPLEEWLPDELLQAIAAENNLSETAFFVPADGGFELRWFTPTVEVDLCGHATLATAHVILRMLDPSRERVEFETQSGPLVVSKNEELLVMDFPARPPRESEPPQDLILALGGAPEEFLLARDWLVVYPEESAVRRLRPVMSSIEATGSFAVIVTAPGEDCDFVSRFFAPSVGVPEDPVTGSAHCTLVPYWSNRLGRTDLHARQLSARGGELFCRDLGDRVEIAGRAVLYLEGSIEVGEP
jgi:PhzF family phenazine biosynthesis protein